MGWFDGITNIFKSGSVVGGLVKTVAMGYVINKLSASSAKGNSSGSSVSSTDMNAPGIDNGVRLQVNPQPDEKIPVLYGSAYFGGIITEAVMSNSNQRMSYVLTLAEKTGNLYSTSSATSYTFNSILYDDQTVYFKADGVTVDYTVDRAGNKDESLRDLVKIYCYAGGSASANQKFPTGYSGTQVNAYSLISGWTSGYAMTNLIFAVVEVNYSAERNIKGIGDIKFQVTSSMNKPGDVLYDYITNSVYGANIAAAEVDTVSISALNTYSNSSVTYTDDTGSHTLTNRYQINGLINTDQAVMKNVEDIANTAGSWLSYSILTGKWGVIINKAGTSSASFDDTNILGSVGISGTGLQDLYNAVKTEFPNRDIRDTTDYVQINLDNNLRNANEQDNTLNITYNLTNEPVQAQLLGFIELKQSRIDKVITFQSDFTSIGLAAGEIIDVTNSKLGFTNKLFRVITVAEVQGDDALLSEITALEYDSTVYDEDLTRYTRVLSNGLTTVGNIGIPGTPTITKYETAARPRIEISTTAPTGVIEGIEYWLSNDVGQGEAQRSYRLIATKVPTNGNANVRGTFTSGTTVSLDYDTIGTSNLVVKTRAYNSTTVGPFSSNSAITSFTATQATDAILPTTQAYNELGGLMTALSVVSLLNNLDGLFGNSATSSGGIFDKIKGILFPDDTSGATTTEEILAASPSYANSINAAISTQVNSPAFQANVSRFTGNLNSYSIDALGDVDTTTVTPVNNDILYWNGTNWVVGRIPVTPVAQPPKPGDGGYVPPVVPPTTLYLGFEQFLPNDLSNWQDPTIPADPNQAPQTGSYYIYFSGQYGNASYPVYDDLTIGSGSAKLYKSDGTLVQTVSASSMTIDKNRLEIPFATRAFGTNYYVLLEEGVVDYCNRTSPAITDPMYWNFNTPYYTVDAYTAEAGVLDELTPPNLPSYNSYLTISSISYPTSNACPNANLTITFSEAVATNSGTITVYEDNVNGELIAAIAGSTGIVNGATINYGPVSAMEYSKTYYISVSAGIAKTIRPDAAAYACGVYSNIAAPIITSNIGDKTFSTANPLALASYTLTSLDAENTVINDPPLIEVSMESNLNLFFNRRAYLASGNPLNISIYKLGGTLHQTFNLKADFSSDYTSEIVRFYDGSSAVSVNTAIATGFTSVSLNPTVDFAPQTSYYCLITSNILKDGCGANYAGISDSSTITWNTVGYQASETYPPAGASNITVNNNPITLGFGQPIVAGTGRLYIYNSSNVMVANLSSTDGNITYS